MPTKHLGVVSCANMRISLEAPVDGGNVVMGHTGDNSGVPHHGSSARKDNQTHLQQRASYLGNARVASDNATPKRTYTSVNRARKGHEGQWEYVRSMRHCPLVFRRVTSVHNTLPSTHLNAQIDEEGDDKCSVQVVEAGATETGWKGYATAVACSSGVGP